MKTFAPGQTFEGHEIVRVLGKGGQATVYLAHHPDAPVPLALKVISPPPEGYPPDVIGRYRREVDLLSQLDAPHIVRLLRHGRSPDGVLWLAFEYLEGEDLSLWLAREKRLDSATVRTILQQLLKGLDRVHRAGIIHRDIKPQNIRRVQGNDLHVALFDFGIARGSQPGATYTALGELVGTPRYMSPEQLRGRQLTPASDIYSLGLVALELLLGSEALAGNSVAAQLDRVRTKHSFEGMNFNDIEPTLLDAVLQMTLADPSRRYQTAQQVLQALGGDHTTLPYVAPFQEEVTPPSKVPRMVAIAAGVVIALSVVTLVVVHGSGGAPETRVVSRPSHEALIAPPERRDEPEPVVVPEPEPADDNVDMGPPECWNFEGIGTIEGERGTSWSAYVPKNIATPARVIVFYNDAFTPDPLTGLRDSGMADIAEREGLLLVAPFEIQGYGDIWRDVDTISTSLGALDALDSRCIDQERIYLVGNGNGGLPAELLRCHGIAAIAILRYRRAYSPMWYSTPAPEGCEREVPTLYVAAEDDCRFPEEGGRGCNKMIKRNALPHREQFWRSFHDCTTEKKELGERFGASCYTWEGCKQRLETCVVDGASVFKHSALERDEPYTTANTTELVWDFLKDYKLEPEPGDSE